MTPAKFGFESVEIEMRENDAPAFCEAHAIDEAGMICAIRKNNVIGAKDGAQQSDICRISGSEIKRASAPTQRAKSCSSHGPRFVVAGQQARSGGRDARRCFNGVQNGLLHARIGGEAEVIVRAEIDATGCFKMTQLRLRFEIGKFGERCVGLFSRRVIAGAATVRARENAAAGRHPRVPDSEWSAIFRR